MNTLSSVSNQSGALHSDSTANEPNRKGFSKACEHRLRERIPRLRLNNEEARRKEILSAHLSGKPTNQESGAPG